MKNFAKKCVGHVHQQFFIKHFFGGKKDSITKNLAQKIVRLRNIVFKKFLNKGEPKQIQVGLTKGAGS